jgi:hypothetical protein
VRKRRGTRLLLASLVPKEDAYEVYGGSLARGSKLIDRAWACTSRQVELTFLVPGCVNARCNVSSVYNIVRPERSGT